MADFSTMRASSLRKRRILTTEREPLSKGGNVVKLFNRVLASVL